MQVVQTEYAVAYALVAAMVLLGLLAICIPRPRKKNVIESKEDQRVRRRPLRVKRSQSLDRQE
jgi:hypothetical protein